MIAGTNEQKTAIPSHILKRPNRTVHTRIKEAISQKNTESLKLMKI